MSQLIPTSAGLYLSATAPPPAGFNFLSSTGDQAGVTSSTPINTIGAGIIVFVLANYGCVSAITDSMGNTWSLGGQIIGGSGPNDLLSVYYCISPAVSISHTFSCTSCQGFSTFVVAAFSGTPTALTSATQNASSSSTTIQAGSVSIPGDSLVITALQYLDLGTGTSPSINSGFTIPQFYFGGGSWSCAVAWQELYSGTTNPQWTFSVSGPNRIQAVNLVFN